MQRNLFIEGKWVKLVVCKVQDGGAKRRLATWWWTFEHLTANMPKARKDNAGRVYAEVCNFP